MRKTVAKGRKLQEEEVDNYVEKIIRLFDNLNDKDLFISIYKNYVKNSIKYFFLYIIILLNKVF